MTTSNDFLEKRKKEKRNGDHRNDILPTTLGLRLQFKGNTWYDQHGRPSIASRVGPRKNVH